MLNNPKQYRDIKRVVLYVDKSTQQELKAYAQKTGQTYAEVFVEAFKMLREMKKHEHRKNS